MNSTYRRGRAAVARFFTRLVASRDTNPFLFWLQMWLYLAAAVLGSLGTLLAFSD